jgi:hypothetical protein
MALFSNLIQRGLRSAQPAASAVSIGTLYHSTDDGFTERSTGSAWESYGGGVVYAEVTVTTGELLALNATPTTIVAAPGAGKVLVPIKLAVILDYAGVAYAGIAAGEDLVLRYTNGSGVAAFTIEATGFLDATADAIRLGGVDAAAAAAITPVANAALVLHMATGEITTGTSPLRVKLWYSLFSTGL